MQKFRKNIPKLQVQTNFWDNFFCTEYEGCSKINASHCLISCQEASFNPSKGQLSSEFKMNSLDAFSVKSSLREWTWFRVQRETTKSTA